MSSAVITGASVSIGFVARKLPSRTGTTPRESQMSTVVIATEPYVPKRALPDPPRQRRLFRLPRLSPRQWVGGVLAALLLFGLPLWLVPGVPGLA
jgi:hypothetical protein